MSIVYVFVPFCTHSIHTIETLKANAKANEKPTTKTTFAHCAIYHAERNMHLCAMKRFIYLRAWHRNTYVHTQGEQENETLTHPYLNHRCNLWHMKINKELNTVLHIKT